VPVCHSTNKKGVTVVTDTAFDGGKNLWKGQPDTAAMPSKEPVLRTMLKLTIAFVLCSAVPALIAETPSPVLHNIPGPLAWKNPPLEWKVEKGELLSITAGKQTDWFISPLDGGKTENSPKLFFQPADDFVLSAKVTVDFRSQWDAGVLVLYANDAVWAKLCFEMSMEKQPTIVSVVTRTLSDDNNSIPIQGNSVYLKIAKIGQAVFFYASADGKKWSIIRAFSLLPAQQLHAGFSSQSPQGDQCKTVFSEIEYRAVRVNPWTGE
jgi:regulation of enolase protein 1 (concanavalin A-like superfamily)